MIRETLRADLPDDERRWLVLDADLVLGLDLDQASADAGVAASDTLGEHEQALLAARDAARVARDWALADVLRDELAAAGIELVDGPGGTTGIAHPPPPRTTTSDDRRGRMRRDHSSSLLTSRSWRVANRLRIR